jgi:hypothetical protein
MSFSSLAYYYSNLAKMAVGIFLNDWPVTLLFAALVVIAAVMNSPFHHSSSVTRRALLLVPLVFPFAIIAAGARLDAPAGEFREDFAWQACVVYVLFLLHVTCGIWIVYLL